ncbi:MAG TPA: alpha/beta fold hydrolase [Candidatus Acidoferrales bacterium]|nr:alpha/beta fold hydrolase [Candidatus Acidoferrales bacterium]
METFAVDVPSGKIQVRRFGDPADPAVFCLHGLSSNACAFDPLGERLASARRQVVALDLRGRGLSEKTRCGTYGWKRHASDLFDVAGALGIERFDVVGHSMGALVGMNAVALDRRKRIGRLVAIDALARPTPAAALALTRGAQRLRWKYRNADDYVHAVRGLNLATPWNDYWERHYRYEVEAIPGEGVRARTKIGALYEDTAYAAVHSPRAFWQTLALPVLVLRAARGLGSRDAHVVASADLAAFLRAAPAAGAKEIDANHFGVVMHDDSLSAIGEFLC